jgi:hypothetical protein
MPPPPRGTTLVLKCLPVRIPFGPGETYADATAAGAALRHLVAAAALPRPAVVDACDGTEAYWALTQAIEVGPWRDCARLLELACEHYGVAVDHTMIGDPLACWRTPGTWHLGFNPARPIEVVALGDPPLPLAELRARLQRTLIREVRS